MTQQTQARKVAIVTGAAGGIGSAVAARLAEAGYCELILCDVSAAPIEAVAGPLRRNAARVDVLAGDVADVAFPAQLLSMLQDRAISAFVHTAGISPTMGSVERIIAVNLEGTARLVAAIRDRMAAGSAAVLLASNSSYFPMPAEAATAFTAPLPPEGAASLVHHAPVPEMAYPLSKLGVRALVKREAKSFGERGVRLVSISPGVIDTPMSHAESAKAQVVQHMITTSAIGRMGRPQELAEVVAFLCSPAASFITACDILVDGGQTAAMGL